MSIRKNIEDVMKAINSDPKVGVDVQAKAVAAIQAGAETSEWEAYMQMFAKDPAQLARLLPTDDTAGVPEMDLARANLVGNGTCGAETTGFHLIDGVGDTLDEELES